MDYQAHPLCKILPEMQEDIYKALVRDIAAKGLNVPILLFDGQILDGRHRYKACKEAGVNPLFVNYTGSDPAGYVASSCLHRNLSSSQRAMIAFGFLEYEKELAKTRQVELGRSHGAPLQTDKPEGVKGQARERAGARLGVGGTTVSKAARVIEKGSPELIDKVRSGEIALNEATKILTLGHSAQKKIVELSKSERSKSIGASTARSTAAKLRHSPTQIAEAPGTPFLRMYLSAFERLAIVLAEQGIKDERQIAKMFETDMDWNHPALVAQFERALPVLISATSVAQTTRWKKTA